MATAEDVALLGPSRGHLLVRLPLETPGDGSSSAGPGLAARLTTIAAGGALNLRLLDAASLAAVFLPAMLPAEWRCGVDLMTDKCPA